MLGRMGEICAVAPGMPQFAQPTLSAPPQQAPQQQESAPNRAFPATPEFGMRRGANERASVGFYARGRATAALPAPSMDQVEAELEMVRRRRAMMG